MGAAAPTAATASEKPLAAATGGLRPVRFALLLAPLCGAASAAAELALAVGAEVGASDEEESRRVGAVLLLLGLVLLGLVLRCCFLCFHSLGVPLADFAPLLFGYSAAFRVAQAQLLSTSGPLPPPNLEAAGGLVLLVSILAIYRNLLTSSPAEKEEYKALASRPGEADAGEATKTSDEAKAVSERAAARRAKYDKIHTQILPDASGLAACVRALLHSEHFHKGWQYSALVVCFISYYAGVTQALFLISPPAMLATAPSVERSNLQLITYLCTVGMPLASFMVIVFSLLIPLFKFATTFLVMHPPAWVTRQQHAKFCTLLCAMSPYQMSDIFLVMLILAYLNTGFAVKGDSAAGYNCQLCSGFKSFFVYCVVSIFVAQVLEIEHAEALEEADDTKRQSGSGSGKRGTDAELSLGWFGAGPSASDEVEDGQVASEEQFVPGVYAVVRRAAVVPTVHMSGTKEISIELRAGDLVDVLEISKNELEQRVRGRIANPPGWISLLDTEDGYRWAERQEGGRPPVEDNLAKLLFFSALWSLCMFCLLALPCPPMSLQARSGGVIIYRQEPTLVSLFNSLFSQSVFFTSLMAVVLLVTPVLFALVALARILLFRYTLDPVWARRLWIAEQVLKPWVMGDVAAVSITALFLSIQEPSTDFVFLCVRLPSEPMGFLCCLGTGVASWGLRWCALPLRPQPAGASSDDSNNHSNSSTIKISPQEQAGLDVAFAPGGAESPAPSATDLAATMARSWWTGAPLGPELEQRGAAHRAKKTPVWLGKLVWREVLVWLFWFTVFWQLGPHEPPSVHSLEDLNSVLRQEVPRVNLLLLENVPSGVGNCAELRKQRLQEGRPMVDDDCKDVPLKPIFVKPLHLRASLLFIDGISTLRILEAKVLPESAVGVVEGRQSLGHPGMQRWAVQVRGEFTGLKVWAKATKGGHDLVNGYICCQNPYHLSLQVSVFCSEEEGFQGNATVDDFHIDPVSLKSDISTNTMFQIDMGDSEDLVHEAIKSHLESAIIEKTGGVTPAKAGLPPFALTGILNKVLWFNGGTRCPEWG
ncbi:unnamed protein product [Polarella glacialis]|uniref:Uncharacterized protein n=1 Tax=Polarella glacialis TaxID=89957 RepID=A0A813IFI7_POLGL|nr:unnamed protein product [Polarella glacialis]